ncbi:hypothetical protein DID78_04970 [Candidatus Marinamargulisbacteria bacterium SCGC AG-343-D04]|nr:hypothetical protein DID78_04970 [Candidatus Marinamargulisbacteria bacterium SCGC AG-343-D04]
MKKIIGFIILTLTLSPLLWATSKTLPQGVWKIDAYQNNYEITEVGANPSGDKVTWERKGLKDAVLGDVYLFTFLDSSAVAPLNLDLTTKVANYWKKRKTHLDISYGLTDKFTLFANMSHEQSVLDYTDGYVHQSLIIENVLGDSYELKPDNAEANHMNDIFVGFKYKLTKNTAFAYKMTSNFLKVGIDANEKRLEDGYQELETSQGYDEYHVYLFKDTSIGNQPIHLTAGYAFLGKTFQNFLDNKNIKINAGNLAIMKVAVPISLPQNISINTSITGISHERDKYRGGNSAFINTDPTSLRSGHEGWTKVPNSNGFTTLGSIELVYQPKIFLRTFLNTTFIMTNDIKGQIYDFPGRIQPGTMVIAGLTLFAK